jgi:predicted TIM-barrel fold metal-dependent hydrolase
MELSEYLPKSALVVKTTKINRPRFPVIDMHSHLGEMFGGGWDQRPVSQLLDELDRSNISRLVDLDGGWGEDILYRHLDKFKQAAPERFLVYGGVDWSAWPEQGDHFGDWAANRLREQVRRGAQGLKIWKPLGLSVRDHHQNLVDVGDPRLDPIWQTAGELNIPITIHVGDPVAFFWPVDGSNERYEELVYHKDWQFTSPPFPPLLTILSGLREMVKRNPRTTFVGAHVGCYAEDLGWVGEFLEECPNFYVDIAARVPELGRQPYSSRRFFLKYASQIVFGMDLPANLDSYRIYYRFLESDDEYFDYDISVPPPQGRWRIYGIFLPDEVLEKVYHGNAEKILGKV